MGTSVCVCVRVWVGGWVGGCVGGGVVWVGVAHVCVGVSRSCGQIAGNDVGLLLGGGGEAALKGCDLLHSRRAALVASPPLPPCRERLGD